MALDQLLTMLAQNAGASGDNYVEGQNNALRAQALRLQLGQAQAAQQQQQAYQQWAQSYLTDPTPQKLMEGATLFPDQAEGLSKGWKLKDDAVKQADQTFYGQVYAAAKSGKNNILVQQLKNRRQAEAARGIDVTELDDVINDVEANEPDALKSVQGYALAHIYAGDPGNFAKAFGIGDKAEAPKVLGYGDALVNPDGSVVYQAPDAPFTLSEGQARYANPQTRGGDPGLAGGDIVSAMIPITLGSESGNRDFAPGGGILTSSAGAQGRMQVMPGTQSDPGFGVTPARNGSMEEKARVGRDYLQTMLQRYGGDPAKAWAAYNAGPGRVDEALASGGNWLSKLPAETRAYVAKNMGQLRRGGQAAAGPQAVASQPKAPPQQTRILSPQEIAAIPGLDPNTVYQQSKEGTITLVGGQKSVQLKPWPAAALASRASSDAALANIGGAINLLDPKNQSKEAKTARGAIGFGTGMLGDWFTQRNNPEGTDARARIGQIGGLIIKDTSGAAVTLSEDKRLAKWVPLVTDSPTVAYAKLKNLDRELKQRNEAMDSTYSEDQGYRPFKQDRGGQAASSGFRVLRVRPK